MKKRRKYRDNEEPTSEGFIGKLFSATADRLPAHVSEEQDWYMDTPDVRLARVFTIVLILHVVAVGGILAFKMIDKASAPGPGTAVAATESDASQGDQPAATAPASVAQDDREVPVTPAAPDPLIMQDPTRAGLQQYLVSRGETMASIAKDLKLNVKELETLNSIHVGNQLYPGQWIAIPKREEATPRVSPSPVIVETKPAPEPLAAVAVAERPPPKAIYSTGSKTYVVQKGDTPYGIARQFGMSSEALMSANGISKAESLQVGATLKIPVR